LTFQFRETRAGDRAPGWLRCTALLAAAFLALACGRAITPGLCANAVAAASVATQHDDSAIQPLRSCCASLLAKRAVPAEAPRPVAAKNDCALCALAAARFEPLVHATPPIPALPVPPAEPAPPVALATQCSEPPHPGRGPPLSLPA
jgi:hypothetical protein